MGQLAYLPTTQLTNNYQFIEQSFPELYRLSQEVEKLNLRPPVSGELINKIKQISNCNKIPGY